MGCRPAEQFCCGCSVLFGVQFIMILTLLIHLWILTAAVWGTIFLHNDTTLPGYTNSMYLEQFMSGLAVAGIPVILLGYYGVLNKSAPCVALFFYYLSFLVVLDYCAGIYALIFSGSCGSITTMYGEGNSAFMCAIERIVKAIVSAMALGIQSYFLFVVFSYFQDLEWNGNGASLADLDNAPILKEHNPYIHTMFQHEFHEKYGAVSVYEATCVSGLGDSKPIFGNFHDMNYPPKDNNKEMHLQHQPPTHAKDYM